MRNIGKMKGVKKTKSSCRKASLQSEKSLNFSINPRENIGIISVFFGQEGKPKNPPTLRASFSLPNISGEISWVKGQLNMRQKLCKESN